MAVTTAHWRAGFRDTGRRPASRFSSLAVRLDVEAADSVNRSTIDVSSDEPTIVSF